MAFRRVPYDSILGLGNKQKKAEKKIKKAEKALAKGNVAKAEKKMSKAVKKTSQVNSEKRANLETKIADTNLKVAKEKELKKKFIENNTPVADTPPDNTGQDLGMIEPPTGTPDGNPTIVPPVYTGGSGGGGGDMSQGWQETYSSEPQKYADGNTDDAGEQNDTTQEPTIPGKFNIVSILIFAVIAYLIYKQIKK